MAITEKLEVSVNDEVLTFGVLGPLCIYLYRDMMKPIHIATGRAAHRSMFKRYPDGLAVLILYRASRYLSEDSGSLRTEFLALMKEADEFVKVVGVSIEQTGFLSATIRASASGMTLLSRPKYTIKYSATTQEAITWIATQGSRISATLDPRAIEAAVARMESLAPGALIRG
ncbi:MAG: hypothetical protein Q8Q09_25960 [Deltaproteobacteria bacterium]|nr:hypothetical protein [Deltaproteobacteria bacterium]